MEANVFDINLLGMEKNMLSVVTGGSSGVGAALVSRLAAADHSIINLDVQAPTESVKGCEYRPLDLSDAAAIAALVEGSDFEFRQLAHVCFSPKAGRATCGITRTQAAS